MADQIKSFFTVLESFGNAKTPHNPSASRYQRYLELQFSERGRIHGAKALAFGLDKSRLVKLSQEERSFHVFYQFLAGAAPEERELYNLEDPSEYELLASSGCYRLPAGPFSDDSMAMDELRAAFKILGFKSKTVASIFSLLHVILLLSNLRFMDSGVNEQTAYLLNPEVLTTIAQFLGVSQEELEQAVVNKTNYVRRDVYNVFLNADGCRQQLNQLQSDLYAILFAYVVEMANLKVDVSNQASSVFAKVILFDGPGYQSRAASNSIGSLAPAPLIAAQGQNSFNEFCINFANECVHSYVIRNIFEDAVGYNSELSGDGISLPNIPTMENSACIEMLRGAQVPLPSRGGILAIMSMAAQTLKEEAADARSEERADQEMLARISSMYGNHASLVVNPANATSRTLFAVNHYAGQCTYDAAGFAKKDADLLDPAFVSILRRSTDGFIARLVSGPSLATEGHPKDPNTVVQAQVSSMILRRPTGARMSIDELPTGKVHPITTQIDYEITRLLRELDGTKKWIVSCIRPNDTGSPNSFDKRRVKSQIRSLLLPDYVHRKKVDFVVDYDHEAFCERYSLEGVGEIASERIRAFTRESGFTEGIDFAIGHRRIWLTYAYWKAIDDGLRADEKDERAAAKEEEAASMAGHGGPGSVRREWSGPSAYEESVDDLAVRGLAAGHSTAPGYTDANAPSYSPHTPMVDTPTANPFRSHADPSMEGGLGWSDRGSQWDKDGDDDGKEVDELQSKEGDAFKVNSAQTVEEVPTSAQRKWWLRFVWFHTWWIPSFMLASIGRMKRPDVQIAWREKFTICWIIFCMCASILFVTIFLEKVTCPEFNKAWTLAEVQGHGAPDDFWVAVYGEVYDLTKWWRGNHGTSTWPSDQTTMITMAGFDLTANFPIPFPQSCPGLVTDEFLMLTPLNQSNWPTAIHMSGPAQSDQTTNLQDVNWFQDYFLTTMKKYRKGPVVWDPKEILNVGQAQDSQ